MLLQEVINHIKEEREGGEALMENHDNPIVEYAGLTGKDVIDIFEVMALTRATEEFTSCLQNVSVKGSRYQEDLVDKSRELFPDNSNIADILENNQPHFPFFISSIGTELITAISTKFSTDFYAKQKRVNARDKDTFYDYYRTDTGIAVGIGHFSQLNQQKYHIDVIEEIFKNSLGTKDARSKQMPEHLCLVELGKPVSTSMVSGNAGEAFYNAVGQSPLFRIDEMTNSHDSVTKLFIGDGGMGETSIKTMSDNLELEIYKLWRHYLEPSQEDIGRAQHDIEFRKLCYSELFAKVEAPIKFEINIMDNGIAISRTSQATHPMGDVLSSFRYLEQLGIAHLYECDGTNLEQVLQLEAVKSKLVREKGIVVSRYTIPRPGGHSASNFSGFGEVPVGKTKKALTLNAQEVEYHQNTDPLLNAARSLIQTQVLSKNYAIELIEEKQKNVIKTLSEVMKDYTKKTRSNLNPIMAWTPESAQKNWDSITTKYRLMKRDSYWKGIDDLIGYSELISKTTPIRMDFGSEKIPDGKLVSPIQAENFSLADIIMLYEGRFIGVGQDLGDIDPERIQEVMLDLSLGLGGINRQSAKLQTLLHVINPDTGKHHIVDNGIDEPSQYDSAAGFKRAYGKNGIVFLEIQFTDYDFFSMSLEQIASAFQRTNGFENIPIIMRQSSGFFRGSNIGKMWGKEKHEGSDGAGGMYHTTLNFDFNRFPGVIVTAPNTSRAVQMAYRNAVASETPTLILMSEPVMKSFPMKLEGDKKSYFDYESKYLPLHHPLDPVGTHYAHPIKSDGKHLPIEDHNHLILSYGEYVPLSALIAGKLYEHPKLQGDIRALVIDYNTLNPRDKELPLNLLKTYIEAGKDLPPISIISQQSQYGFGSVIKNDIDNALLEIGNPEHIKNINYFHSAQRKGSYLENHLKNPHIAEIYDTIIKQHQGKEIKPYKASGEMEVISNLVIL